MLFLLDIACRALKENLKDKKRWNTDYWQLRHYSALVRFYGEFITINSNE